MYPSPPISVVIDAEIIHSYRSYSSNLVVVYSLLGTILRSIVESNLFGHIKCILVFTIDCEYERKKTAGVVGNMEYYITSH